MWVGWEVCIKTGVWELGGCSGRGYREYRLQGFIVQDSSIGYGGLYQEGVVIK